MTSAPTSESTILNQIVDRIKDLYTLPAVALEVVRLTGEPKVDCKKLKECIENDPALTCKILKFVNSPIYGRSRKVSDLQEALAIVGIKTLKLLVLGFSLPANLMDGIDKSTLAAYWRFSLTKAVAAREFNRILWDHSGDDAFIGGMLQHVGMLALIQELGKTYTTFLNRVWNDGDELQPLEVASMGFDHTILSARLLDSWCLPGSLVRAIGRPNTGKNLDQAGDEQRLIQSLHLADLSSNLLARNRDEALTELARIGKQYGADGFERINNCLDHVEGHVKQLAELLDLELDDNDCYADVLARARERLEQLAAESALESLGVSPDEASTVQTTDCAKKIDQDLKSMAQKLEQAVTDDEADSSDTQKPDGQFFASDSANSIDTSHPEDRPDPGIEGKLHYAITRCRHQQRPIGLTLIEIDDFDQIMLYQTKEQALQLSNMLQAAVRSMFEPEHQVVVQNDCCLAVIAEGVDADRANQRSRQLLEGLRKWSDQRLSENKVPMSISIGLGITGVPAKNFQPEELLERAERCLSAAKLTGGNKLKTIVF